jgi:co-chaperonin GroES (HSP10)
MAMENPFDQKIKYKFRNKIKALHPLQDHIIVHNMNFGGRTLSSGVILLSDDGKTDGIRPRWAEVYAVGPDQKDVRPGQWVLVEHGRWTRGTEIDINGKELTLRRVDITAIMIVSDESPTSIDTVSTAVHGEYKQREYYGEE